MKDRYQGKPFLLLLEKYILDVIGELKRSDREGLEKMTPKLQRTFNHTGSWSEIVSAQLRLTPRDRDSIARNWKHNKQRADSKIKSVSPEDFARFLADQLIRQNPDEHGV